MSQHNICNVQANIAAQQVGTIPCVSYLSDTHLRKGGIQKVVIGENTPNQSYQPQASTSIWVEGQDLFQHSCHGSSASGSTQGEPPQQAPGGGPPNDEDPDSSNEGSHQGLPRGPPRGPPPSPPPGGLPGGNPGGGQCAGPYRPPPGPPPRGPPGPRGPDPDPQPPRPFNPDPIHFDCKYKVSDVPTWDGDPETIVP